MKTLYTFLFILFFAQQHRAQILLNGDFLLGNLFWGCGVETNAETAYGGSSGLNTVAEIDAGSSMCQTVSGLTIGKIYALTFSASRRTGSCPAPLITQIDVMISGAFTITVERTNAVFGLTTTGLLFLATATSHNIIFQAGTGFLGSTCGMIIDNVAVTTSALPVELASFTGTSKNNATELAWSTVTEQNNDHFEVERSSDGIAFQNIISINSKAPEGNSSKRLNYAASDLNPLTGISYYRLKQVDRDLSTSYSKIIAVNHEGPDELRISLFPNPGNGLFTINLLSRNKPDKIDVRLIGPLGKELFSQSYDARDGAIQIDARGMLKEGFNYCIVSTDKESQNFPLVIE